MRTPTTRELVLLGAALVGASTAATSAVSLYQLAVLCGIPEPLSAALPIALDAGAGITALAWVTERGPARTWGKAVAIAALIATVCGNAVQHAVMSGLLAVTLPLVLAVGSCIPAMLFAVVHLVALMARPAEVEPVVVRPRGKRAPLNPQPGTAASPPPVATPAGPTPDAPAKTVREAAAERTATRRPAVPKTTPKEWARANWPVAAKEIELGCGVSRGYSFKIRDEVKAEMAAS